jgi:hypothetical protein
MHKQRLLTLRRKLLRALVPEWFWPKQVLLDGVAIPLRRMPWSFGTKWLIKKDGYEAEERLLLQQILTPGMQVIEMGGSIGILSAIIAEKIGAKGKLVSVEASAQLTRFSYKWLAKYPWVTVVTGFAFPVWDAQNIVVRGFNEDRGNLGGVVNFTSVIDDIKSSFSQPVWDIGALANKYHIVPEMLVIDVEGSEQVLLEKPGGFPDSLKHVLIELHPGFYPNGQADKDAIIRAIEKEGFEKVKDLRGVYLFSRK